MKSERKAREYSQRDVQPVHHSSLIVHRWPLRTCIACGAKREARALFRIAVNEAGEAFFDATRRATGRGAHLCRDRKCIEKALARGALSRSFKKKIIAPPTLQNALKSALQDDEAKA